VDILGVLFFLAMVAYFIYDRFFRSKNSDVVREDSVTQTVDTVMDIYPGLSDYSGCYQRRLLFTKNEYYNAKKLYKYAAERDLIVCPKVRLLDIIEPMKGEKYQALLGKIKSKHVDFVVCSMDLRILGVIELDDNSHDTEDRKNRDQFVDSILMDVGYRVVRVRGITETTLDAFAAKVVTEQI
jgi:very-short-patch-repair endonuclease